MELKEIEYLLSKSVPGWKFSVVPSGSSIWIDILIGGESFSIQWTSDAGVGVTRRSESGFDFGGHDEVFKDLESALSYIQEKIG